MEYWDNRSNSWWGGPPGKGVEIKDPEAYAMALGKNGTRAKVTVVETGEVLYSLSEPVTVENQFCDLCEDSHTAPFDGSCLL